MQCFGDRYNAGKWNHYQLIAYERWLRSGSEYSILLIIPYSLISDQITRTICSLTSQNHNRTCYMFNCRHHTSFLGSLIFVAYCLHFELKISWLVHFSIVQQSISCFLKQIRVMFVCFLVLDKISFLPLDRVKAFFYKRFVWWLKNKFVCQMFEKLWA